MKILMVVLPVAVLLTACGGVVGDYPTDPTSTESTDSGNDGGDGGCAPYWILANGAMSTTEPAADAGSFFEFDPCHPKPTKGQAGDALGSK